MATDAQQPSWADAALADEIALSQLAGETQTVEFKAQFPKQLTDLGKEIAAFATSNAGTILLGIADDGSVTGLEGCEKRSARQGLVARIEGVCASGVKPAVTPAIRFAVVEGQVVAAIEVPKGKAPVYYSANIPYLRQLTAARPMMPDEVVEAVLAWDQARRGEEASPTNDYLSAMTNILVDVIVRASEIEVRDYGAGLDETRYYLGAYARQLRDLAAQAPEDCAGTVAPIRALAEQLDIAAHEEFTLGSGYDEMSEAARAAVEQARAIAAEFLKPEYFNPQTRAGLDDSLAALVRRHDDLTQRIDALVARYKLDELRSDAGSNGLDLRKIGAFLAILGDPERGAALDAMGARLREIEARETYMDGGQSQQAIIDDLRAANAALQALVSA
ncbi:helix-turn-helix domain-containing protein [uncultured Sphingomonas sp.]|uniref:AlbA family DNA-binding domain-containing protein n=1 Tax=uncultured Sphingomonas sp. TaxID=158754 RepID=UPI002600214D|nr:ATP-binding protein [uncultured Sphingomonas sp.]